MSKHNYSQYAKSNTTSKATEVTAEVVEEIDIVDTVAESTVDIETTIEEIEETPAASPKTIPGTVTDCTRLNVRVAPSANAEVVCVLDVKSQLEINVDESVTDWYKVCTATGIEGYCMKQFITAAM